MGLCYKCGERFGLRHICRRQLLNMEGEEKDKGEEIEDGIEEWPRQDVTTTSTIEETEQEQVEISFHALKRGTTEKTIKVQG